MAPPEMALSHTADMAGEHVNHEKFAIRLTLIISLLAGPAMYMLCNALITNFAQGQEVLALAAVTVMAFEIVWIVYGFGALIHKATARN
jgi:hypothetical protein